MDKLEPKEKEVVRKITYKHTWPGITHVVKGAPYNYKPISVRIRVINGKMEDVIINGKHFILDVNHAGDKECLIPPGVV